MFFKKIKFIIFLILSGVALLTLTFYFQDLKKKELAIELKKILIKDVRIGVGRSKGKLGTAIFGEILNNGTRVIKIATIKVFFLSKSGEVIKEKNFFPVNNYSFSDGSPLEPGKSKEFGFSVDDIVPENWSGEISTKLVDLKFK
tara:strand:+ start:36 stop:467 length:432 start_codon:yes stop_codon:yes gene_type:complete